MVRRGSIATFTGQQVDPLNPDPATIVIADIAHALACVNRFTGHLKIPVSVAQHSISVSLLCDPEDALQGLLHDASEAYICDVASPVKHSPVMAGYREAEDRLQRVIYAKFGCPVEMTPSVCNADRLALNIEFARGFGFELSHAVMDVHPLVETLTGREWDWRTAEREFLSRFMVCVTGGQP